MVYYIYVICNVNITLEMKEKAHRTKHHDRYPFTEEHKFIFR